MDYYRNSQIIKFCAEVFPACRCSSSKFFSWRIVLIVTKKSGTLERELINVLIYKAYSQANKMNCME